MQKKLSPSKLKKHYQKHLAQMTHSFLLQVVGKEESEVKRIYESFCNSWTKTVEKVNKQYGAFVLAHGSWKNIWERDAYKKMLSMPVGRDKNSILQRKELMRIVFIVEGKNEKQREWRQFKYKCYFLWVKIKYRISKIFR